MFPVCEATVLTSFFKNSLLDISWTFPLISALNVVMLNYSGPAFIKWGQWASTRPDIFPADICDELSRLHMQVFEIHTWIL